MLNLRHNSFEIKVLFPFSVNFKTHFGFPPDSKPSYCIFEDFKLQQSHFLKLKKPIKIHILNKKRENKRTYFIII